MGTRILALVLKVSGIILVFAAMSLGRLLIYEEGGFERRPELAILIDLFCMAVLIIGIFTFWRGRQYASGASISRINSTKQTILYLRPFKDDSSTLGVIFHNMLALLFPWLILRHLLTIEEQLQRALTPVGYLLALNRPETRLPPAGAARFPTVDIEWRTLVEHQMRESRLVIIKAGIGTGLLWELKTAATTLQSKKLLILVLEMRRTEYEAFRRAAKIVGLALPVFHVTGRPKKISGFINFSEDWIPQFLPMKPVGLRGIFHWPYEWSFRLTLKPIFARLGARWKSPRVSLVHILLTVALALGGGSILYKYFVNLLLD